MSRPSQPASHASGSNFAWSSGMCFSACEPVSATGLVLRVTDGHVQSCRRTRRDIYMKPSVCFNIRQVAPKQLSNPHPFNRGTAQQHETLLPAPQPCTREPPDDGENSTIVVPAPQSPLFLGPFPGIPRLRFTTWRASSRSQSSGPSYGATLTRTSSPTASRR